MAGIKTYTTKGTAVVGFGRAGVPVAHLGRFDPATGTVWQHPRQRLDQGIGGSSVRVTNPDASLQARAQKTSGLGIGSAGQRGRFND